MLEEWPAQLAAGNVRGLRGASADMSQRVYF